MVSLQDIISLCEADYEFSASLSRLYNEEVNKR